MASENTGRSIKVKKTKRTSLNIGYLLLVAGIVVCSSAFDYQNRIMALVGTSIIFWGGLMIYFQSKDYVSGTVMRTTMQQYYDLLAEAVHVDNERDKPMYYTPPNISGLSSTRLLIQNKPKETEKTELLPLRDPDNAKIVVPPGQFLSEAMEASSGVRYSSVNPLNLSILLEKAVIEDLELARSIVIEYKPPVIMVNIGENVYNPLFGEKKFRVLLNTLGDPLISAIACAYSRSTSESVTLEEVVHDDRRENSQYRLVLKPKIWREPSDTLSDDNDEGQTLKQDV